MGGACNTYGGNRGAYRILVGDLREGDHFGDPGVDGRIILKMALEEVGWGMDWIELAQHRERWRDVVNAVMNLRVP
jgi:hypothetical protein